MRGSDRESAAQARNDLAARASMLLESPLEPKTMLERATAIAVPEMADLCIVDLLQGDGSLYGAAVSSAEEALADELAEMRRRWPLDPGGAHPVAVCARTGDGLLLPALPEEQLREFSTSAEHLELMLTFRYSSAIVVPLAARGRTIGVFSLLRLGDERPPYEQDDLEAVHDFARRAALALDNARLFAELARTEAQLEAILTNLAEGVLVQDGAGEVVFANQAAAELFGVASAPELSAKGRAQIVAPFVFEDADGRPLALEEFPTVRARRGDPIEPTVVRRRRRDTGEVRWWLVKSRRVALGQDAATIVVTVLEDITDSHRAELGQRFLASASKLLSSSLDVPATLDKAAWAAVPELADWCRVDMPDERGVLREVALAHTDGERRDLIARWRREYPPPPDADRGPWAVLRTGRPVIWSDVSEDDILTEARDERHAEMMRTIATRSLVIVPMTVGDRTIGAITLATTHESGRTLDDQDLELALELGRRAGIAVEHARAHAERTHIATVLQRDLRPPRLPEIPGLTLAARFRAAGRTTDVGGDFYDLFPVPGGWMVVMGDVTGKGPGAAAITSLARHTMRTAAGYEPQPEAVLARLNAALAADPDQRRLCTAVCGRIEPADEGVAITLACAGHPPPYLLRAGGGDAEALATAGTLLGAFEDVEWTAQRIELAPGESLVFYTDGVTDTRGEAERFGPRRLEQVLAGAAGLPADDVAARVDEALKAFERGTQRDDVALLVLRAESDAALAQDARRLRRVV